MSVQQFQEFSATINPPLFVDGLFLECLVWIYFYGLTGALYSVMRYYRPSKCSFSSAPIYLCKSDTQRIKVIIRGNTKTMVAQKSLTELWQAWLNSTIQLLDSQYWNDWAPTVTTPTKPPSLQQASGNTVESGKGE